MSALDRKLLRDLLHMKWQVLAIGLVISCGVAMFIMSLSTLASLDRTRAAYYERYRFADVFAHLKRAPNSLAARIADIPGVAQVQTRVVVQVNLDVPSMSEPAAGRLISIPERPTPGLNGIHLRRGRYIEPGREGEVLVGEAFAEAHQLEPGDTLFAVINGRKERLRIVGIVLSPEYIYQIRPGDLLPDDRHYGIFWMGTADLSAAFNMQGAFNDVALTLMPGASEPEVLRRLDLLLGPYGSRGAYGREEQTSHKFISNEMRELRGMGKIAPTIFLAVAAFLLNMVMSRLITLQREQIAALKAFGYSRWEVGWHYLKLVLGIVLVGVVLGIIAGVWLGRELTEMYTRFFRFPVFEFYLHPAVVLGSAALSMVAGVLGTLRAVRRAMTLPPAEAMRPEPPASYRPTVLERLGLQRFFSPALRMILRHLERQPVKSFFSCLGIAMASAVLVLGSFMEDAIDHIMEIQFFLAQRQDMTVTFVEPASIEALYEIRTMPGVLFSEGFRSVPVRMRAGYRSRRLGITGLEPDAKLNRLIDLQQRNVQLPPEGLVVSEKLAEILAVKVGDLITLEVLEGERPVRQVPVAGLISDFSGTTAYMDIRALNRLLREGDLISGVFLSADPHTVDAVYTRLKNTPRVAGVAVKRSMLDSFRNTIAENLLRMRMVNVIFATIIAFGVVYNSARISLSERSRELATLRVLGFTRAEISFILLGELAVLVLASVPAGLVLGYGFAALITAANDSELFRMPLVVYPSTYAFAATVVVVAAILSGLIVRRLLDHLDLVAVLKARE